MGYKNKIQVISRSTGNKQYYLMCPRAIAEAVEFKKGEIVEWIIKNQNDLIIKRKPARKN